MSENIFASIIDELAERELARYAEMPAFRTSEKHDRAMRRIFKRYERNARRLRPEAEIRVKAIRRRISVALLVIILAVITGFTAAYFISRSFRGEIHKNSTVLFPIATENCPSVIENKYYIAELPDGFEEEESDSTPFYEFVSYENKQTGQTITFRQWAKNEFDSTRLNTEKGELEEEQINGHSGFFLDVSNITDDAFFVIWDSGDYILELAGNLSKNSLLNLANSARFLQY